MQNKNISVLSSLLTPLKLDIEKSSARRRFLRLLKDPLEDYSLEREEIINEFAEKGPDGKRLVVADIIQYSKDNRKKAQDKIEALTELAVAIDFSKNEADRQVVIEILNGMVKDLEGNKEFDSNTFDYLEIIKEIISELK